ncbi:MAG: sodium:alanine symporter family protein, partial [Phaeodactylibacter sp.]|nr:sodium:alanine symporter family protein [Phaeodactylibacter sp.]
MRRSLLLLFASLLTPLALLAQEAEKGWDQLINEKFQPFTDAVAGIVFYSVQLGESATTAMPIVIILLLTGATIFTLYFRFIQFTGFKTAIDTVRGKYSNPDDEGEVSHFQALTAALSGT